VTATTGILRPDLMDLLLRGGTLVTCDPDDRVTAGALWISDGRIAAMGDDAAGRAIASGRSLRVLDVGGCAVVPGFVQAHVHLCQTLFRGMGDDLPLLTWLQERIWPLEAAHDPRSLRASADLGIAELIKGGTTTVLDMGTVHHHDAVFEALRDAGLRAVSGKTMMDAGEGVPAALRETTAESLAESDGLCARWHGAANGRLRYAYSPRFILSCTEQLFRGCVERARARGALMHTHAAEHPGERDAVRAALGMDDVDALHAWGFAGPDVVVAHGVQLTPKQRRMMGREHTRVAHCPSANLKLGSGIARVAGMHRAGIVVGIGADGAPCNNNLDALQEMRLASLLAKRFGDTGALPAARVLRMATIDGARALGIADEVGSLEVGKRADVTVIDLSTTHAEPWGAAPARIVYAAQSRDVRHVVVDGRVLLHDGRLTTLDEAEVRANARVEAVAVRRRAGVTA
jgi:cytosine/adenosine deaminase-related metal-dependent hydrolase